MASGIHWRSRSMLLVILVVVGVGALVMQRFAFSLLSQHQTSVRTQVQRLREEGARFHSLSSQLQQQLQPDSDEGEGESSIKVILMHSFPDYYELSSGPQAFSTCNRSCTLTLDQGLASEVNAVVLFSHNFNLKPNALTRSANQVWVYFAVESPFNTHSSILGGKEWHHFFNWTMTYRRDSTFYHGYGDVIRPALTKPQRDFGPVVKGKTKMVAWFVSNCHTQSKREDFVSALKQFIPVDVYGECGPLACGTNGNHTCLNMLSTDYYFYLAFENSMCKDYVTEKLYRTLKQADVVPVVRGGANYSTLLPKDSFIDAAQFPSVKALADYLKKVAGDSELYQQHLAWKNSLTVVEPINFKFCDLCFKLHNTDRWAHIYPDIDQWWSEGACYSPPPVVTS